MFGRKKDREVAEADRYEASRTSLDGYAFKIPRRPKQRLRTWRVTMTDGTTAKVTAHYYQSGAERYTRFARYPRRKRLILCVEPSRAKLVWGGTGSTTVAEFRDVSQIELIDG